MERAPDAPHDLLSKDAVSQTAHRPLHVLITTDQHVESLGGVQVSIRLQREQLERQGHTVSVLSSARRFPHQAHPGDIELPSWTLTRDKEYTAAWPGKRADRVIDATLAERPPVDLVHVQGDLWGAIAGYRLAQRLGVPVVHTFHNNLDQGVRSISPIAAPPFFAALNLIRKRLLGGPTRKGDRGGWRYLASLSQDAQALTAPSHYFAEELQRHGIGPATVITNGVDDAQIDAALAAKQSPEQRPRPRLVWLGRMSQEKRVLDLIEALRDSGADADLDLYGGGIQLSQVKKAVSKAGLEDRVRLHGRLPYPVALAELASADALVQTSLGFETQGMTPFEAAALGTPTIFRDPRIAAELGVGEADAGLPGWVSPGPSLDDFTATLRQAVAELKTKAVRVPDAGGAFRQSRQTERTLELYRSVVAEANIGA